MWKLVWIQWLAVRPAAAGLSVATGQRARHRQKESRCLQRSQRTKFACACV
jgi:hypothetical protein